MSRHSDVSSGHLDMDDDIDSVIVIDSDGGSHFSEYKADSNASDFDEPDDLGRLEDLKVLALQHSIAVDDSDARVEMTVLEK
ncbi:unnamed protein product [Hermetia illucens]|uniref:Uncharacterized protein n=1 Tax=Hermetia illucens TaxID=343691 RepID=A0A7R8UUW6_HERIL|nr:unnamed protein product [Hermetia illucens]